jgi:hypothetical protein
LYTQQYIQVMLTACRSLVLYTQQYIQVMLTSLLASSQHNLYVLLRVQCWTPDDEQRNCPKHVYEFYSKNKFEKLVHLVGFIIRIYHDARSSECQTMISFNNNNRLMVVMDTQGINSAAGTEFLDII